jgi:hypothetical protein
MDLAIGAYATVYAFDGKGGMGWVERVGVGGG